MTGARLVVLAIALAAGGLAFYFMSGGQEAPPAPTPVAQIATVDVLIAGTDLSIGQTIKPSDMQWQAWPAQAANPAFIRKTERPDATEQLAGSIVRIPMAAGEPVRESKVIKAKGSGYMAAILPAGMRAVSTDITVETGAGGFILPNDRVDVILSRRATDNATEQGASETILSDVRVLAIDQTIEDKNGQKVVVGKTATMELTPHQAETLVQSRQQGTLSLALRSLADSNPDKRGPTEPDDGSAKDNRMNVVRFGVTTTTMSK